MLTIDNMSWLHVVLTTGLSAFAAALVYLHMSKNAVDLSDLVKDPLTGKLSLQRVSYVLALGIVSWIMIDLQTDGQMQVGYFSVYCTACVAPLIAKMFIPDKPEVKSASNL